MTSQVTFPAMFHHLSGFSTFEFLLNLFQVVSPGLEKQETLCLVNSATSLDMAPTEEASIFSQILHDKKEDLDYKKSGLDFMLSTWSEADRLERKEAVRTVRMTRTLQCHIVNNISTAYQFPYIEDNLCHTVKAVLQGPTSFYSCSDEESLIYQSVSSSLHGNHSDGKIFMKNVRVDMTSIQSICFGHILVDLHLSSNIVCGESDGQAADSTVDDAKCEGIDLVYRKMRSEEDDQQEELDIHRITDRHQKFPGKEQYAVGEDDMRSRTCIFLQSKATSFNEGKNTPCEIISTDSKHILPLTRGENASHLTSESKIQNITDTTPLVDSVDSLQRSHNELAVGSDQSLGNNKWLQLKAEAVHDLASSHSSLSQAAQFHKPLKVNYASLHQQPKTEDLSSVESRVLNGEICDRSVIGTSFSTSSISQVHLVAQSENYPCISSSQQIKTIPQSSLPSLSVAITSSVTTSDKQCDTQVNKSESLTAVSINTLSQGVSRSSESENKVKNSKKSLTITLHSSAAGPSAPMQSLKDDRSKASSHEQSAGRSRKLEDSKRSQRRFHPYKKQEKKRKYPSCSFETTYRDLAELLQNLTSKTYKQSSKAPRVTNSWKSPTSRPSRFSNFRFCRSEVPLLLPRSGSPSCEDDLNSMTPDMIPNFEERHRTAELLEELYASRNEETYNKEECTYQREPHDTPDDLLPALYPILEKSKKTRVIKDDTELSFIQDQTDLLPGSRTTLFSRTHLSDMSVGDKTEVYSRGTDIALMDEDMNDHKDRTFPKEGTTQMQDKNDKKNTTFQSRSPVKSPGLASEIALDCFPNVMSQPMESQHGCLHQHAPKTELDSSMVKEGNPCIPQVNNNADDKKSEELLFRQQISRNCLDNVNMNTCGHSEKLVMEDGDFVNSITAIIDGKQMQSTFSKKETHRTQTPLKYFQRNYEDTKSQGCLQESTQIECQNSVSLEFTDNNSSISCIHEKREEAKEGSGMQQQNQVLASANIGSDRDSGSSVTAKSAQGTVHGNEIEPSNTEEKYNSKSHHSYASRTLTNRNVFSFFETKFLKNEDESAIFNKFDFSPILVDSKQRSVDLETVTRKEVSASELFSKDQEPKFAIDDTLQSSAVENKLVCSAANALSVKFELNSNTSRSLIAKYYVEDEGSQIVSRYLELRIPEVDAATDNDSASQSQISNFEQDVNGEICSRVKRQQVHCSFDSAIVSDSQIGYNKIFNSLETQSNQDHIEGECKISVEEKDGNSHGSLEVAHIATLNAEHFDESVLSFKMMDVSSYADREERSSHGDIECENTSVKQLNSFTKMQNALSTTAEMQVHTDPANDFERTSLLTIKGYKDVEYQGSKDCANEDKMLSCRPSYRQHVNKTQKLAEQTVSSPVKDNNFAFSYAIASTFKGKEIESVLEDYSGQLSDENEPAKSCKIQTVKWNTIPTNNSIKEVKQLNKALLNVINDMDLSGQVCLTHQDVGLDKNLSNRKDVNAGLMFEFQQVDPQVSSAHQVQVQCFSCSQKSLESSVAKAEMPGSSHSAYNNITPWDSSYFSKNHDFCVIQSGSCKEDSNEAETCECSQENICFNVQGGDEVLKQSNGTLSNIVKESDTVQTDFSVDLGIDKVSCEHTSFSESNGVKGTCSDTGLEISGVHGSWSWIYDASNIKPLVDNESATCFATPVYLTVKPTQITASFMPSVNKVKEKSSSGQHKIIHHSVKEDKVAALNPKENSVVFNMDGTREAAIKDGSNSKLSLSTESCKKSYNRNVEHTTNANIGTSKLGPELDVDGKNKKLIKSRIDQYPDLKLIGSKKNEFPIKVSTARQNVQTATPSLLSKNIESARVKCFGENIISSAATERKSTRDDKKSFRKSNTVKKGSSKIDLELKKFYDEIQLLQSCGEKVVSEEKCYTQSPMENFNPYKSLVITLQELMKKPASKIMNGKSAENENNIHDTYFKCMFEESVHKNSADVANTQKMSIDLSRKGKNFMSSITPLEMISSNYSPEEEGDLEKANRVHECFGTKSNQNLLTLVEPVENDLCQVDNDTSNRVQESCDLTLTGTKVVTSCIFSENYNNGTSDVSCPYTCKSFNVIDETLVTKCSPMKDTLTCIMPEIHYSDPSLLAEKFKQQSLLAPKIHNSALHSIFSNYYWDDLEENSPDTVSPAEQGTGESISSAQTENIIMTSAKGNQAKKADNATSKSTHDHHNDQVIITQQDSIVKGSDKDPLTQEVRMANAFLSSVSRIACDHSLILNGLEKSDENHKLYEYTASNIPCKTKDIACSIEKIDPNPNTCFALRTRDDYYTDNHFVSVQTDKLAQADDNKYKMEKSEESAPSKGHSDRAVYCTNTHTNAYSAQRHADSRLLTQHYSCENCSTDNEDTVYSYEPCSSQVTLSDEICTHAQRRELQDTQFLQSRDNDLYNGKLVSSGCKLAISKIQKDKEEEEKAIIGSFVKKDLKDWSEPQYLTERHLKNPEDDSLSKNLDNCSLTENLDSLLQNVGNDVLAEDSDNLSSDRFPVDPDRERQSLDIQVNKYSHHLPKLLSSGKNILGQDTAVKQGSKIIKDSSSMTCVCNDIQFSEKKFIPLKKENIVKKTRKILSGFKNNKTCFLSQRRHKSSAFENLMIRKDKSGRRVFFISQSRTTTQKGNLYMGVCDEKLFAPGVFIPDVKFVATKTFDAKVRGHQPACKRDEPLKSERKLVSRDSFQSVKRSECAVSYVDILSKNSVNSNKMLDFLNEENELSVQINSGTQHQYRTVTHDPSEIRIYETSIQSNCNAVRKVYLDNGATNGNSCTSLVSDNEIYSQYSTERHLYHDKKNNVSLDGSKYKETGYYDTVANIEKDRTCKLPEKFLPPCEPQYNHKCEQSTGDSVYYQETCLQIADVSLSKELSDTGDSHGKHIDSLDEASVKNERNSSSMAAHGKHAAEPSPQEPCSSVRHSEKLLKQLKYTTGGFVLLDDSVFKPGPKTVEELSKVLQALQGIITNESLWIVGIHAAQICNLVEQRLSESKRVYADQLLSLFSSFRHSCLLRLLQSHSCDAMEVRMTADLVQCAKTVHFKEGLLHAYVLNTAGTEDDMSGIRICSLQTFTDLLQ